MIGTAAGQHNRWGDGLVGHPLCSKLLPRPPTAEVTMKSLRTPLALCGLLLLMSACESDDGSAAADNKNPTDNKNKALEPIPTGVEFTTSSGPIVGKVEDGVRVFRGIPYAAPPVGDLRFRPPAPHVGWTAPRTTTEHGKSCLQANFITAKYDKTSAEDCLVLSVYTPQTIQQQGWPVMFWIHGGAFLTGHGGQAVYDGKVLAKGHNVVVVTINYRLGVTGFGALGELAAANVGLQDQVAALSWVKANARRFGGDPDNITIFGESAGGMSVCALLAMPSAKGLFARAIIQSGLCHVQLPPAEPVRKQTIALAEAAGCKDPATRLACMRKLGPEQLVEALKPDKVLPGGLLFGTIGQPVWFPYVDGDVLPDQITAVYDCGKAHAVPVIIGTNHDEARLFHKGILGDKSVDSDKGYVEAVGRRFGKHADAIVKRYPAKDYESFDMALAQIGTHALFTCPARRAAKGLAQSGDVYRYHFEYTPTGVALDGLKVFHAAELPYVFGNDGGFMLGTLEGDGVQMSAMMRRYWTNFARKGTPNFKTVKGPADADWPKWTADDDHLVLSKPAKAAKALEKDACDFWDTVPVVRDAL